jgi:hypothetical protein
MSSRGDWLRGVGFNERFSGFAEMSAFLDLLSLGLFNGDFWGFLAERDTLSYFMASCFEKVGVH